VFFLLTRAYQPSSARSVAGIILEPTPSAARITSQWAEADCARILRYVKEGRERKSARTEIVFVFRPAGAKTAKQLRRHHISGVAIVSEEVKSPETAWHANYHARRGATPQTDASAGQGSAATVVTANGGSKYGGKISDPKGNLSR
jgi:hypothetical protein